MTTRILVGDCREKLRSLDAGSIHTCVTSPPYFGLRDYGTAEWEGGSLTCDHVRLKGRDKSTIDGGHYQSREIYKEHCAKCGATRNDSQIGLEQTPAEFIAAMVDVFREVKRVLRDDGTVWLNLGDSYYNYRPGRGQALAKQSSAKTIQDMPQTCARRGNKLEGLKDKDLIGIPWKVAFALQEDGWYLRQDIVWHKPNPMPESVGDRCTKAHEYIFLLTKQPRYYFDDDAIREPIESDKGNAKTFRGGGSYTQGNSFNNSAIKERDSTGNAESEDGLRKKRSVWSVSTRGYEGAHFATYPPELIEPCIKAGYPAGGTVLDPFFGSGTTGLVADRLGRNCVGVELNPKYAELARRRIEAEAGMFAQIDVAA